MMSLDKEVDEEEEVKICHVLQSARRQEEFRRERGGTCHAYPVQHSTLYTTEVYSAG